MLDYEVGVQDGDKRPRVGNYRLEARLGGGGMAEVYLATAVEGPLEGRQVAIKRLRPEYAEEPEILDRFLGEADLSRMISDPGLVEIFEVGSLNGTHYLVMEYVEGRNLREIIDRCKARQMALPIPVCTHVVSSVLESASAIHGGKGADGSDLLVVHCDLTPANVFLSLDGDIKVGDLGVALVGSIEDGMDGVAVGKLGYLAPEQVAAKEIDRRVDVFAVGVMFFEMLTGSLPFPAQDIGSLEAAFRAGPPDPSSFRKDVPGALAEVVLRALATDPSHRFYDAPAFLCALARFQDTRPCGHLALAAMVRMLFR